MEFIKLSEKNVETQTNKLYKQIIKDYDYDLVIFIAKGSFQIGKILSDKKNVPLLEVKATRKGNKLKKLIKPLLKILPKSLIILLRKKEVNSPLHNKNSERNVSYEEEIYQKRKKAKRILLVDDSVDTGHSIIQVLKVLKEFFNKSEIRVAALNCFEKAKVNIEPDYYIYTDYMLQGPWSNDSNDYNKFINSYNNWYNEYISKKKVKRNSVSVAMATYNGEKYIKEQIDSIMENLNKSDELIISDDGSNDNTIKIIDAYKKKDTRIKLIKGPQKGVKKNFENAISKCKNEIIFLSDQDDIWTKNKVSKVLETFQKNDCLVVEHDCKIVGTDGKILVDSFFEFRNCNYGVIKNIYKNTYIGCCMAFRKELKNKILPIPNNIEMHDQWIGIIGDSIKKSVFIKDKLILYRRHEDNASDCFHHHPLNKMIKNRINIIIQFIRRKLR